MKLANICLMTTSKKIIEPANITTGRHMIYPFWCGHKIAHKRWTVPNTANASISNSRQFQIIQIFANFSDLFGAVGGKNAKCVWTCKFWTFFRNFFFVTSGLDTWQSRFVKNLNIFWKFQIQMTIFVKFWLFGRIVSNL